MSDLNPIVKSCAGLDVHKKMVMATIIVEQQDGNIKEVTKEFGTFPNQRKKLALWLESNNIELIVMESTGVYWKSIYSLLWGIIPSPLGDSLVRELKVVEWKNGK